MKSSPEQKQFDEKNFLMLGGWGKMGRFYRNLMPIVRPESTLLTLDRKGFNNNEAACRRRVANSFESLAQESRNRILLIALFNGAFDNENKQESPDAFRNLLGLTPELQKEEDCLVSLTSLQNIPLKLLDEYPGVSLGIHHLHRPEPFLKERAVFEKTKATSFEDLEKVRGELVDRIQKVMADRSVVITATKEKQNHPYFEHYLKWWNNFLKTIGYQNPRIVTEFSPEEHDRYMAQLQFLTSSMFLVAGLFLKDYKDQISKEKMPIAYDILQMAKRVISQSHEVYQGIAKENPHNLEIFQKWEKSIGKLTGISIDGLIQTLIWETHGVGFEYTDKFKIRYRKKLHITTPNATVRDWLLYYAERYNGRESYKEGPFKLEEAFERYRYIINHPDEEYQAFFEELRGAYPDYKDNESTSVIDFSTNALHDSLGPPPDPNDPFALPEDLEIYYGGA